MGEVNIDAAVRKDLIVEVAKIASQGFDYLIIELSGILEPMPVVETFTFEDATRLSLGEVAGLDKLVTVVDGSKFLSELNSIMSLRKRSWHTTPDNQQFANVIIVNKCDLLSLAEKGRVFDIIQQMNPTAKRIESVYSKVPLEFVLGTGLFSLSAAEEHNQIGEHIPETIKYGISSFTYRARRPFFPNKLADALNAMIDKTAPFDKSIVLQAKEYFWLGSFYSVQGEFSLAGSQYALMPGNPWWAEIDKEHWSPGLGDALIPPLWQEPFGDRQQEIVIIGQSLDKDSIIKVLDDCLLTEDDLRKDKDVWVQICTDAGDPFYED
ncbi:hypothetical protein ACHAW5_004172 [Stephanodiscus triporus]|uniref:CobW C-terminal domain-containing protein n=1 Tax=Stephanodiscus triporus TaxID=2934178 RepID=A0ABD3MZ74_9STRA